MSDEADFIRAIVAAPDDAAPRLVYADWLEERGGDGRNLRRSGQLWVAEGFLYWQTGREPNGVMLDTLIGPTEPPPCERGDCDRDSMFAEAGHWFCPTCWMRLVGLMENGTLRRAQFDRSEIPF